MVPSKFHKVVFLKKGDFVIVEMEKVERLDESKVVGSVVHPLHSHQLRHLAKSDLIPERFAEFVEEEKERKNDIEDMMPPSDDEDDLGGNPNRRYESSSEEESSDN